MTYRKICWFCGRVYYAIDEQIVPDEVLYSIFEEIEQKEVFRLYDLEIRGELLNNYKEYGVCPICESLIKLYSEFSIKNINEKLQEIDKLIYALKKCLKLLNKEILIYDETRGD